MITVMKIDAVKTPTTLLKKPDVAYVGKASKQKQLAGSILANPYHGPKANQAYHRWLWKKINMGDRMVLGELLRLMQKYESIGYLVLVTDNAESGQTLANCLEYYHQEGLNLTRR